MVSNCQHHKLDFYDSKMIEDLTRELLSRVDPDQHTITLPDALDFLQGKDA